MALTPDSATNSYLTPADFFTRFDIRTTAMLCSDDNSTAGVPQPAGNASTADWEAYIAALAVALEGTTPYSTNLAAALSGGSGQLESSLFISNRYQTADLQDLTGVSLEFLKDIVAPLAAMRLYRRRGGKKPDEVTTERYAESLVMLKNLETGEQILSFVQTEAAGLPENQAITAMQVIQNQYMTTQYARVFGCRTNTTRYPLSNL